MKNTYLAAIGVLILIAIGVYWYVDRAPQTAENTPGGAETSDTPSSTGTPQTGDENEEPQGDATKPVIGKSVEGRDIVAYHFGDGNTDLLFVGGTHGGYSWNTALVAYQLIDHLTKNPDVIPDNVRVTVIPVLNPDGLKKVVDVEGPFTKADVQVGASERIAGRFNAHDVDLNRNFDCEWQEEGVWQSRKVSGGDAPFSEPETQAFKSYIEKNKPDAVVVWYSAAGGVYASNCQNGVLEETTTIMNVFAKASKYTAHEEFNFYEITGDMVNWLAKEKIPGISVLLTTHESTDWEKNRAGVEALLKHYAQE